MTVRIKPETREALDAIAATLDRDRSYVVNQALAAHVKTHRWHVGHIRQGLNWTPTARFQTTRRLRH